MVQEVFTYDELGAIGRRAKLRPWDRDALLRGMPIKVRIVLPNKDNTAAQIDSDLDELNRIPRAIDGVLPIERWVTNAANGSELDPDTQKFFRDFAELAFTRIKPKPKADTLPAEAADAGNKIAASVDEKIWFENDLLQIGFLEAAKVVASSVAKITVTAYASGAKRTSQETGREVKFFGTCWLIGPRHVITNHHVICARSPGEAAPEPGDFELQAVGSEIEFDFDSPNGQVAKYGCASLIACDEDLDFAILEIAANPVPLNRNPLALSSEPFTIVPGKVRAVNIVQHPGGETKQLAIRNNAAASNEGKNLAYYTDTRPGSSGSPVCDDDWKVVALHKAATRQLGKFTYQGRENPWINIGTPITLIIQALENSGAWDAIGARTV